MDNKVVFQDCVSMISIQAQYCIGGYVTYEILISTCGFAGKCNFCIKEKELKEYVKTIDTMTKNLSGEIEIRDSESDAFLKFYFENTKTFDILGQIGGSYEDNTLKFKFRADQTVLYGLKEKLLDY